MLPLVDVSCSIESVRRPWCSLEGVAAMDRTADDLRCIGGACWQAHEARPWAIAIVGLVYLVWDVENESPMVVSFTSP